MTDIFTKLKSFLIENQTPSQTVKKNATWLFFGQIGSRLFRATIVIYAARLLGAEHWGIFSYALGIATFLTSFSDIGVNALLTKEASRHPELKDRYLSTAFFVKLTLLAIIVAIVLLLFPYLTNAPEAARIMPILIFVFVFDTLRDLGSSIARALQKMQIEALTQIFTNFLIALLGFLFLMNSKDTHALALAYALGSGLGLLSIIYTLRDHFRRIGSFFTLSLVKPILSTAWPFGLMGLMGTVNLNTDIVMLGWLRTPAEVGYYAAAQKIVLLLYVLPTLLATSLFPLLSRLKSTNPDRANRVLGKSVMFVLFFAALFAVFGIIFAEPLILLIFGEAYAPSTLTFQILMATLLIVYPSTLLGNAIFAYDYQKSFVKFVIISILGNTGFNLLLIPSFGIAGAAASTLLTQIIVNWLMWHKLKTLNGFTILPSLKEYLSMKLF